MVLNSSQLPEPEAGYDPKWEKPSEQKSMPPEGRHEWPKLSIVTPSFNQGRFIERTIRCILLQNYPNLEYIVIDGGSTDETLKIIKKYERWISYWSSEPDTGMYDALNKGFAQSTGEIMAWSPTGDFYEAGALRMVGQIFAQNANVEWLTSLFKIRCSEDGEITHRYHVPGFCKAAFMRGLFLPGAPGCRYTVQQQSTFWRRSLWDLSGSQMDASMIGAGDFELWSRFFTLAELYCVNQPIGVFRSHEGQTSNAAEGLMYKEQSRALHSVGGRQLRFMEALFLDKFIRRKRARRLANWLGFADMVHNLTWDPERHTANFRPSKVVL